jgi:hypothetical protein
MQPRRFSLVEYAPPKALIGEIVRATGLNASRVIDNLQRAGERSARLMNLSSSPLLINSPRVQAVDFAGLMRVGPSFELEVAPKFLGLGTATWREDFFFLAMLSKHGRLLGAERLRALSSPNGDLATLVARSLIQMFWDQHRRPIRTYRRQVIREFGIEGDVDAEELRSVSEEGIVQTVIRFDRANLFNAVIKSAATELSLIVRDTETRASLKRIATYLGGQGSPKGRPGACLPSRSRAWQTTFELALDILKGFGVTYDSGRALAPGFVVNTWRVWEDLVTISLRASLGGKTVVPQVGFQLGYRQRRSQNTWGDRRALEVTPDLKVYGAGAGFSDILIDAKYKGRLNSGKQRVAEADVYEAMAFGRAAKAKDIVLAYPKTADTAKAATGAASIFERVDVDDLRIWGVEVEVRGISRIGALRAFANGVVDQLREIHGLNA